MPDVRSLLSRSLRLKRRDRAARETPDAGPEKGEEEDVPLQNLPSIEGLGPDSDYTVFMRRNVPAVLRRAALRQAWTSNPAIAQHKPLVDYDWDFHAPDYGKLRAGDDPTKFLVGLFAPSKRQAEEEKEASDELRSDAITETAPDGTQSGCQPPSGTGRS
jgi:hypothetical protein